MDIVEQARNLIANEPVYDTLTVKGLVSEIERLREQAHYHYENGLKKDVEIERLREALQTIADEGSGWGQSVALAELKGANDGN